MSLRYALQSMLSCALSHPKLEIIGEDFRGAGGGGLCREGGGTARTRLMGRGVSASL
jgi:hypothetical protein